MTIEPTVVVIIALASVVVVKLFRTRIRHEFTVYEGYAGLLYHEGKLTDTLAAGRHIRWGKNYRVALIETRKT